MIASLAFALALGRAGGPLYKDPRASIPDRVRDLVRRMTLEEEARQLDMYQGAHLVTTRIDDTHAAPDAAPAVAILERELGSLGAGSIHDLYPSPRLANELQKWVIDHDRLGVPALFIEEGVHGYLGKNKTIFPCSINLASTFDAELAGETGAAIAAEARADNVHMLLCPVLDIAREPRWGRVEEDFGEDPYLSGSLAAEYVHGMQGAPGELADDDHTVAEPKHFAGHGSPESGTNTSPTHAGEREVRSIFLRSFQAAVQQGGALGIMAAYNEIDGVPCTDNRWLLTDVLRGEWGFRGFVLSDLGAINMLYSAHHVAATPADAVRMALRAGVDMQFYDFDHATYQGAIVDGVRRGLLPKRVLDRAVSRVLTVKFMLGLFDHPFVDPTLSARTARSPAHLDLALRSARESICLLKNAGDLLPLKRTARRIVVIGPNGDVARMGDYTEAPSAPPPSLLDELRRLAPGVRIDFDPGVDPAAAAAAAKGADVAILALGERDGISGEGSDRSELGLPDNQEAVLEAVAATGAPVVLVLQNGRPLALPWAAAHVPAIVEAWYPGERGAQAIAETLFGLNDPSGRLPISFPRGVGTLPDFYDHDPSKRENYVDGSGAPLFPFGAGLSYTSFAYSNVTAQVARGGQTPKVIASVEVENTGERAGTAVVELYLHANTSSVAIADRALVGFRRVALAPGERKSVSFELGRRELEIWGASKRWSVEPGGYALYAGGSSAASEHADFTLR